MQRLVFCTSLSQQGRGALGEMEPEAPLLRREASTGWRQVSGQLCSSHSHQPAL